MESTQSTQTVQPGTTSRTETRATSTTATTHPMTATSRSEHVIEFTDSTRTRRRIRFVPHPDGDWWRIEETWTGCVWRHIGRERVTEVRGESPVL